MSWSRVWTHRRLGDRMAVCIKPDELRPREVETGVLRPGRLPRRVLLWLTSSDRSESGGR